MSDRKQRDIERRLGYELAADLNIIKDIILPRAKALAAEAYSSDPSKESRDIVAAAYEQARAEYLAAVAERESAFIQPA